MLPRFHIILGAIFTIVFILLFPQTPPFFILLIFLSSFLIDIDHYFYYVFKKKDISLRNAVKWFMKKEFARKSKGQKNNTPKMFFACFHSIEFLMFLAILSPFSKTLFYILIGLVFHVATDTIDLYRDKSLNLKNLSLYFAFRRKR